MESLAECSRTLDLDFVPARSPRSLVRIQASQPTFPASQQLPAQGLHAFTKISRREVLGLWIWTLFLPAGRGRWFESRPPSQVPPSSARSREVLLHRAAQSFSVAQHHGPTRRRRSNEKLTECTRSLDLDSIPARWPRALVRVQASQPNFLASQPTFPARLARSREDLPP